VLSRLGVARSPRGAARLQALTLDFLRGLARRCGEARSLCLAANPAMTAIALGRDGSGLACAPYSLEYAGGRWERLPGLPPLWTPPQLSPFVGGDISAGYAALALGPALAPELCAGRALAAYPFLLADMGTNGEFLLALSPDTAFAASVALGPALEGAGLSCGSEARPLAATRFTLGPEGLAPFVLPALPGEGPGQVTDWEPGQATVLGSDQGKARAALREEAAPIPVPAPISIRSAVPLAGIAGTGAVSLLHLLLESKALSREGNFTPERCGPLRRFLRPERDGEGRKFLPLPGGLSFSAADVEEVLKVKAAFSLGLRRLLQTAGIASHSLARVYLAGSLGAHVDRIALENLGFFPPGMASRMEAAGNTSLGGACLLLQSAKIRSALTDWAARVATLDLASDPAFVRDFAGQMRFAW
jgi:uncharacterized 2Fe-2S/4Fe-4S cluster protein (DUF4445 family)